MYTKQIMNLSSVSNAQFFNQFIERLITLCDDNFDFTSSTQSDGVYTTATFTVFGEYDVEFSFPSSVNSYIGYSCKARNAELYNGTISTSSGGPSASTTRKITIRFGSSSNVVCLRFSYYNTANISNDLVFVKNDEKVITAHKSSNSASWNQIALKEPFFDNTTLLQTYTIHNRLDYENDVANEVEIITDKIFLEGTQKAIQINGIYDCSTMAVDTLVMMNNKQYYVLDSNTLIEV